jgi:hypothetical protein
MCSFTTQTLEVALRKLVIVALTLLFVFGAGNMVMAGQPIKLSDATNGVQLMERDQTGLTLRVSLGSLEVSSVNTKAGAFTLLTAQGLDHSDKIGEPSVPVAYQLIAIPVGCDVRTEVISSDVQEVSLNDFGAGDRMLPVQPSLSKSQNPEDVPFEFKQDVYQRGGYYQLPEASSQVVGILRGLRLGQVVVAPVQYDVAQNRIKVYREMVVRVSFDHPDWSATQELYTSSYSPAFEPMYQMVMNSDASTFGLRDDLTRYPMTMVIVSARMFEAQLQPFIAWKIKKGFKVIVGYTDVIGTTNTAIKAYLQGLYNSEVPKPSFVLLVGDSPQIPPFAGSAGSHVTDLRFVEYTGDDVPEVYIGRFSAQTTAELQPQIDKTLEYEQYLMPSGAYLGNTTLIAGADASYAATYGNGQINYGTNLYFNAAHGITSNVWLYPASGGAVEAACIATYNSGVAFANYTAHGAHDSWADPAFTVSDVNALTNNHKYFMAVGNCCVTNTFTESTPCFGEALLQKANGGAIGYVGCTNNSYWDEDYWWGVGGGKAVVAAGPPYDATKLGAYDGTFHDHGEATSKFYTSNGAMNYCGLLAVNQSSSSRKQYYWEMYMLMGDPSVSTYMKVPGINDVVHLPSMMMTSTSFTVSAAPGSYVGISSGGVLHGAALVPPSGSVDVALSSFGQPCTADLVVTGQNLIPYKTTIQVIAPSGPYIVHNNHTINDALGNNNGQIDFGENILLGMELINVGPDAANNVVATLSTTDTYVTITDATENYGTMAGNMTVKNIADGFAFTVDPACPDGHTVKFNVSVTGTGTDTWTSFFNVTTHAPTVAYLSVAVNDVSGNNNGILDPGETAPVIVTLQNTGSGQAFNISATLSALDPKVTIIKSTGVFGNVAGGGGTASNTADAYIVKADSTCPMGHALLAKLTISGDGGYVTSSNFNMTIGDRVPFFFEDFTVEQGWEGLGTAAQWQIGPAIGGSNGSYPSDPTDDHTPGPTNMILGNNLGNPGSYANSIPQTYWVNSPIIDCSAASGVQMSYWHYIQCESSSYDHAYFEVFDGTNWINLYSNSATVDESQWTESDYDLSQYADGNPLFQLRWGLGTTDGSQVHGGWAIDDIQLKGYVASSSGAAAYMFTPDIVRDSLVGGDTCVINMLVTNSGQANLRIRFSPSVSWLNCPTTQNIIAPGENVTIPVTMKSGSLTPGQNTGTLNFVSNVPGHTTGTVSCELYVYVPQVVVTPTSLTAWVDSGATTSKDLVIDNPGPGRLSYSVACHTDKSQYVPPTPQEPLGYRTADPDKTGYTEPYFAKVTKGSGGPDAFGYTWKDSDEPNGPAFNWIDIEATGTNVTSQLADDNFIGPFPIGFNFQYYDSVYTEFWIGANGLIGFGPTTDLSSLGNVAIPTAGTPNNMIAWCWDDLNILDPDSPGGKVLYQVVNGDLVIMYKNYPEYDAAVNPGDVITAEVILSPNGKIKIQYQTIATGFDILGCTVGLENRTGNDGTQIVFNAAYLHNNLAIQFKSPLNTWLAADYSGGFVAPHSKDTLTVTFNAAECIDSTYGGNVTLSTNVPGTPTVNIPVTLHVGTQVMFGDMDNSGAIDISDVVYCIAYIFSGGPAPNPAESGDVNCDLATDISDAVYLIAYIFAGGPTPCGK